VAQILWNAIQMAEYSMLLAADDRHSLAIKSDGTLWAWGHNGASGRLGDGTTDERRQPTRIGTDSDWKAVAAGLSHSFGIKSDGTLWAWGWNGNGRLGDGTTEARNVPTRIGTDSDWKAAAAGSAHSLAMKSDGSVWGWGFNGSGRVGDGTIQERHAPVLIADF
jgi:alpha-tubulin suppressor-like RCC1 family protein